MVCKEARELLSEYIDNVLEEKKKNGLQQHLASCRNCAQELESLRKYVKQMSSLSQLKAPDDFLRRVHERIERHSEFQRIMRKLFVPAKIKIPLEFVGVLATVIIVVVVARLIEPQTRFYLPKTAEKPMAIKEGMAVKQELPLAEYPAKGIYGVDRAVQVQLEGPTQEKAVYEPSFEKGQAAATLGDYKVLDYTGSDYLGLGQTTYPLQDKEGALMLGEKKEEIPELSVIVDVVRFSLDEAFSKIKETIVAENGTVILEEPASESIKANIPAENYQGLLEKIKEFFVIKEPLPEISDKEVKSIDLFIRLTPSE